MLSRRLFLTTLPTKIITNEDSSRQPTLKIEDEKFKCRISVTTDQRNTSYFVQNTVQWYDPITKTEKLDNTVKCYIVDSVES